MNKLLAMAVFSALLVSGCIGQGGGTTTPVGEPIGVEITDFAVEPSSVFSGSTARVIMNIQNNGGANMLTDPALSTKPMGLILLIAASDWKFTSGLSNESWVKVLKRADPATGQTAGQDIFRWSMTAPALSKGQTRTDNIIGRIYYDYETVARGSVWIYPESERDSATAGATFSTTDGPLKMTIKVDPDPPVLKQTESFTLTINLENIGTGTVYKNGTAFYNNTEDKFYYNIDENKKNLVTLEVNAPGLSDDDKCSGSTEELLGSSTQSPKITMYCDMSLNSELNAKQNYPITVRAVYGYYTEKVGQVTISGK